MVYMATPIKKVFYPKFISDNKEIILDSHISYLLFFTALSFKNHIIAYLPLPDSFQVGEIYIYCISVLYY